MKKIILIIGGICIASILGAIYLFRDFQEEKFSEKISHLIGEKRYLADSFNALLGDSIYQLDNLQLYHGNDSVDYLDVMELPCLVIYTPFVGELDCMSCITNAIESVMESTKNFSSNAHICMISVNKNPAIQERIYKKPSYFVTKEFLSLPREHTPYYFVITKEKRIEDLFAPEYAYKAYTDMYLKQIKAKYHIIE
jgi:hypothetical protein